MYVYLDEKHKLGMYSGTPLGLAPPTKTSYTCAFWRRCVSPRVRSLKHGLTAYMFSVCFVCYLLLTLSVR